MSTFWKIAGCAVLAAVIVAAVDLTAHAARRRLLQRPPVLPKGPRPRPSRSLYSRLAGGPATHN